MQSIALKLAAQDERRVLGAHSGPVNETLAPGNAATTPPRPSLCWCEGMDMAKFKHRIEQHPRVLPKIGMINLLLMSNCTRG